MTINTISAGRFSATKGFTLVEMLVAIVVLLLIMSVIFQLTSQTGTLWKRTTAKIQSFQVARSAFESMSRRISQATLNTYYDYFDKNFNASSSSSYSGTPAYYARQSDLHFISGPSLLTTPTQITHAIFFQAPLGYTLSGTYSQLNSTLNAVGYYVTYLSDQQAGSVPSFVSSLSTYQPRYRYRLMQFQQPCENFSVYQAILNYQGGSASSPNTWFTTAITGTSTTSSQLLADNVIALAIVPKESTEDDSTGLALTGTATYAYNTRTTWSSGSQPLQMNQLPPVVHLAMIALDEPSAQKICTTSTAPDSYLNIVSGNLFTQPANLNADLNTLETTLNNNKLGYRLFETDVAIRGAKWSK